MKLVVREQLLVSLVDVKGGKIVCRGKLSAAHRRAAALPPPLRHKQPRRLFTEGACQEDGGFLGGMKGCRVSNIDRKQTHTRG